MFKRWKTNFTLNDGSLNSETERRRLAMLGLSSEPGGGIGGSQLEQGQDAALYHAMSPSSSSSDANNSKMAANVASKGIPISR